MKNKDYLSHIRNLSLEDLQKEVFDLQKKIQSQKLAIAFSRAKDVRTVRNLKRQLAQSLTVAQERLGQTTESNHA